MVISPNAPSCNGKKTLGVPAEALQYYTHTASIVHLVLLYSYHLGNYLAYNEPLPLESGLVECARNFTVEGRISFYFRKVYILCISVHAVYIHQLSGDHLNRNHV